MSFFDDDSGDDGLGGGSIWDSGLNFGSSGMHKLLESGSFTLESLLGEEDFIQEAQAGGRELTAFLASPAGMHGLMRYLAVPQDARDEDRAFRFPYMACEALCCGVPALLDALTDRGPTGCDHLRMLLSVLDPRLREGIVGEYEVDAAGDADVSGGRDAFLASQGHPGGRGVRPYLAGYAAKVTALLCKRRSAAMVRFLDRCPGVGAAMVAQLQCGSAAAMLAAVLALPWAADGGCGMSRGALARGDGESVLSALLGRMETAVAAVTTTGGGGPSYDDASAAQAAADVLCSVLTRAAGAPASKFAMEGYNAARLGQGAADSRPEGGPAPPVDVEAALSHENTELDAIFHSPVQGQRESYALRLMKELRDGPSGARLLAVATDAAACAGSKSPNTAGACEAPLRVLHAVLLHCGTGYRHQAVYGQGVGPGGSLGPCPPILLGLGSTGIAALTASLNAILRPAAAVVNASLAVAPAPLAHAPVSGGVVSVRAASRKRRATAPPVGRDVEEGVAPPPSYASAPHLGSAGLALARALASTLACGWPEVVSGLAAASAPAALIATLTAFPWHSSLHRIVAEALTGALSEGRPPLIKLLVLDSRLLTSLVALARTAGLPPRLSALGSPRKARVGFGGHVTAIACAVLSASERGRLDGPPLSPLLASHSDWWAAVDRELAVACIAHGVLLGGLPPDIKASGNVGNSADAVGGAAKPPSADEVPEGFGEGEGEEEEEAAAAARRRREQEQEEDEEAREQEALAHRMQEGEDEGEEGEGEEGEGAGPHSAPGGSFGALDEEEEEEEPPAPAVETTHPHLNSGGGLFPAPPPSDADFDFGISGGKEVGGSPEGGPAVTFGFEPPHAAVSASPPSEGQLQAEEWGSAEPAGGQLDAERESPAGAADGQLDAWGAADPFAF